jgi:DNA polymerase III alpha subunit
MDRLMQRVKDLGMESVGLTDHGTMSGLLKFQNAADKAGVKSILGCEFYFTEDRRVKDPEKRYYHLTVLAANTKGYENLCRLSSRSGREGFYHKPRVDYELLKEHGEGLIVLTGCMASRTMQKVMDEDLQEAHTEVRNMMECVGEENVYLEIQNVGIEGQPGWNSNLAKIAKDLRRPLVATGDVHYLLPEDASPHDAMLCVQMKTTLSNPKRMSLLPNKYYLRSPQEMAQSLSPHPDSLQTTIEIAERCNARIETGREFELLPTFPPPEDFIHSQEASIPEKPDNRQLSDQAWKREWRSHLYLRELVNKGLNDRFGSPIPAKVQERTEFEMSTVLYLGVTDYFLIVWDLMREAHDRRIPTGPGRGSGAGSMVLYALNITQLDPLQHGLLFERFLNPDRISVPDIDLDISPDRRKELMDYMRDKYGSEQVAQIITFSRIGSKAGIRRAAQAMGHEYLPLADKLAKAIPTKGTVADPIEKAKTDSPEFQQILRSSSDAQKIVELAEWMEGMVQSESVHAAALIVAPRPVDSVVPVQAAKDGSPVSAFDMKDAEAVGLLKLDFLGLRNLDVIDECERLIEKYQGKKIDAWQVPLDDSKTYKMLAKGDSVGVFQFECVAGDTIIGGSDSTIEELYHTQPANLLSIKDGAFIENGVQQIIRRGDKQLYRLETKSHKILRATQEHQIKTLQGWKMLGSLSEKDRLITQDGVEEILRISKDEIECTFDISMKSPHNNYIANGIVVHNSDGMSDALVTVGADRFEDLVAIVALYRPGPMANIPVYARRKHGQEPVIYGDKRLEAILGETQGIVCVDGRMEISCPDGKSRQIKNLRIGEEMHTLNQESMKFESRPCHGVAKTRFEAGLVVLLDDGSEITLTRDHKVLTDRGMVEAQELNPERDFVVCRPDSKGPQSNSSLPIQITSSLAGDIIYRKIKQITSSEEIQFYGVAVPDFHNFVANNAVLSNCYQEQSMLVSRELAGFTPGEADTLRKAIGKKLKDKMAELKPKFYAGCKKRGVPAKVIDEQWSVNEASAEYSFNKSHAAAYALVSYVTAYLKANYPTEYMAALLSSVMSTKDKVPFYLYETKKMGLKVLPPDVNASFTDFEPEGEKQVRFGLAALKGVGEGAVDAIVQERLQRGEYHSLWDFAQRVEGVNRREVEALIKTGAFDATGNSRKGLVSVAEQILKQAKSIRKKESEGQSSLFDAMGGSAEDAFGALELIEAPQIPKEEWSEMERFALEREAAGGIYVSGHPLEHAQAAWEQVRHVGMGQIAAGHIDKVLTVAGIITAKRVIYTKRDNKKMLIITLEDLTGNREVVVFPKTLQQQDCERHLEEGELVALRVAIAEDDRGFQAQAAGDDETEDETHEKKTRLSLVMAFPFDPKAVDVPDHFEIHLDKRQLKTQFARVREILEKHPGSRSVMIVVMDKQKEVRRGVLAGVKVEVSEDLRKRLAAKGTG